MSNNSAVKFKGALKRFYTSLTQGFGEAKVRNQFRIYHFLWSGLIWSMIFFLSINVSVIFIYFTYFNCGYFRSGRISFADLEVSFWGFVVIFYFFYRVIWFFKDRVFIGFRYYSFGFHIFYVFFCLNFVNMLMHYNFSFISGFTYFFISIGYIGVIMVYHFFRGHVIFKVVIVSLFACFIFSFFADLDNLLLMSHVVIYKLLRPSLYHDNRKAKYWTWKRHLGRLNRLKYLAIPSAGMSFRNTRMYYKHFGDTVFFWDIDVITYILVYVCLSAMVYLLGVFLYSVTSASFYNSNFLFYPIFWCLSYAFAGFGIYLIWEYWGSWEFTYWYTNFSKSYSLISGYAFRYDPVFYRAFILYSLIALIVVLYSSIWLRWVVTAITGQINVRNIDYMLVSGAIRGYYTYPMLWKYPRYWKKRIKNSVLRNKIRWLRRRSRAEDDSDDPDKEINYYYGGPNPTMVLFDCETGEVWPVYIKDLVHENYRIYYKLYGFGSFKYPLFYLFRQEYDWVLELFSEEGRRARKLMVSRHTNYFYSFRRLFYDFKLSRLMGLEDRPTWGSEDPDLNEEGVADMEKDWFDERAWESVWQKDFFRSLPVYTAPYINNVFTQRTRAVRESLGIEDPEWRDMSLVGLSIRNLYFEKLERSMDEVLKLVPNSVCNKLVGDEGNDHMLVGFKNFVLNLLEVEEEEIAGNFEEVFSNLVLLINSFSDDTLKRVSPESQYKFTLSTPRILSRFVTPSKKEGRRLFWFNWLVTRVFLTFLYRILTFDFFRRIYTEFRGSDFFFYYLINRFHFGLTTVLGTGKVQSTLNFLDQAIRFGFEGRDFRVDPHATGDAPNWFLIDPSEFNIINSHFSKINVSEGLVAQVFSNFPIYNYLIKWKEEFSPFFEFEEYERFADWSRGRSTRFRFVDPKVILDNETSAKINYYFINLLGYLKHDGVAEFKKFDSFPVLVRWLRNHHFLVPAVFVSRVRSYSDLFTSSFGGWGQTFGLNAWSTTFYKSEMLNTYIPDLDPRVILDYLDEELYFDLPVSTYEYNTGMGVSGLSSFSRRFNRDSSLYSIDIPYKYMSFTTSPFYLISHIRDLIINQFFENTFKDVYMTNFAFNLIRVEKFNGSLFYNIFDHAFSNSFLRTTSIPGSIFSSLSSQFLVFTNHFNFIKSSVELTIKKKDFYSDYFVLKSSNFWVFSHIQYYFKSILGVFSPKFRYFIFDGGGYYNTSRFAPESFVPTCLSDRNGGRNYDRVYFRFPGWLRKWNIRSVWSTAGRRNQFEYYSFERDSRLHVSLLDRIEVYFSSDTYLSSPSTSSFFIFSDFVLNRFTFKR